MIALKYTNQVIIDAIAAAQLPEHVVANAAGYLHHEFSNKIRSRTKFTIKETQRILKIIEDLKRCDSDEQ